MTKQTILLALVLATSGCATQHITPRIDAFSTAVKASTEKLLARYDKDSIEQLYRNELDTALVGEDALLRLTQGCEKPLPLVGLDLDDPRLIDYADSCPLVAARLNRNASNPKDVLIPLDEHPRPADGKPGVEGHNARKLALVLQKYTESLAALANATTPQELGNSFGAAADSLLALRNAAEGLSNPKPGLSEKAQARFDTGKGLLGTVLTEYFEAKRYRLLSQIVVSTDPVIEDVSRAMAAWYYPEYQKSADALQDSLRNSEIAAENAAIAKTTGRESSLAQMRKEYDDLVSLETSSDWKVFLSIASAHREIRKSFEEPQNIEQLTKANQRIKALVDKVAAYVAATQKK